jgi:4-diphosphocytidyl-2-C-methyl-D-erythritol kinase
VPAPPTSDPSRGALPARLVAPAKLTLSLRVVGVRDDGFHLLDAEMVALDLHDLLEVEPARGDAGAELAVVGAFAAAAGDGDDNLVVRALALAGRAAAVRVTQRIPPGAGLGGGSADAAAILRWAGWDGRDRQLDAAAGLGADVAFCLVGGRARVRGIGEAVEPLPFVERTLTLVTPPFGCPTPAVYRAWDGLGGPSGPTGNDLEPAALHAEPRLAGWRDLVGDGSGATPRLAGSGSTWFVEGEHGDALAGLREHGALVTVARTVPSSWTG